MEKAVEGTYPGWPFTEKEEKSAIQHIDGVFSNGQVYKSRMIGIYSKLKFLKLWKAFKQAVKEPLTARLLRPWDLRGRRINLTVVNFGKFNNVTSHSSLRLVSHKLGKYEGNHSLMDQLIKDVRNAWLCPSMVPTNSSVWKTIDEV